MLERDIEKALIKHIESLGGTCEKFPDDVDLELYIKKAEELLNEVGFVDVP
jgi:hypothetical protein